MGGAGCGPYEDEIGLGKEQQDMERNLGYEAASNLLLEICQEKGGRTGTERIPLEQAAGRVLAEDCCAKEPVPGFDKSAYDGYALRAADAAEASPEHPVTLTVTEEVAAGMTPRGPVTPKTAAKILTGAPIPQGADAVVMYEKTCFTREQVVLTEPLAPGDNIIRAGEDIQAGDLLLEKGRIVGSGEAGLLASQGIWEPLVYRRLRVGILSTGTEVTDEKGHLPLGMIRNVNRYLLAAALAGEGMEPVYLGAAMDDPKEIGERIRQEGSKWDALLCTGGVSAGDYDLTPAAMEQAGARLLFKGVDMKPGMACAYGILDGKLLCGLSGNPAAAMTNFYLLALPALRKLAGRRPYRLEPAEFELADRFEKPSKRTRILRGRLDLSEGRALLRLPEHQDNSAVSSLTDCQALAVVPAGSGPLLEGTRLRGYLL